MNSPLRLLLDAPHRGRLLAGGLLGGRGGVGRGGAGSEWRGEVKVAFALAVVASLLWGCSNQSNALQHAQETAANRTYYTPVHDVEFTNYERRLAIADDPTTIWWCTSAFNTPSSPMFTVPVIGKVTSGTKRPFEATTGDTIGQDGMYGASSQYEYGFGPDGVYSQWNGMPLYCTTEPKIWQRESTTIVSASDPVLLQAQTGARAALAAGDPAKAQQILADAIAKAGGK